MSGSDCLVPQKDIEVECAKALPANKVDLSKLAKHDFDPFEYTIPELAAAAAQILFDSFGKKFDFSLDTAKSFSCRVLCASMRDVPFHNGYHAFGVFQTLWAYLSSKEDAVAQLTDLEKFGAVVAALCHDLDHPGLTNTFLINAKNPLAEKYNNISVLESHHLAQAKLILGVDSCAVAKSLSSSDRSYFDKIVDACIGATDLAKQKDTLAVIDEINGRGLDMSKEQDRLYVVIGLVKCSDVSNESKAPPLNGKWATRVNEEFFAQGDIERERKMEMLPMMDRSLAKDNAEKAMAKSQMGFIQFVCMPLYERMEKLLPETMKETCSNLRTNLGLYKQIESQ